MITHSSACNGDGIWGKRLGKSLGELLCECMFSLVEEVDTEHLHRRMLEVMKNLALKTLDSSDRCGRLDARFG